MARKKSINGQSITTKRARPRLGHSAPAKWARKQQAMGNCRACGHDRRTAAEIQAGVEKVAAALKQLCRGCQDKVNSYMKRYRFNRAHNITPTTPPNSAEEIIHESSETE